MKCLLMLLLLPVLAFAQKKVYTIEDMPYEIDSITGGIVYRGVIHVPDVAADHLYTRAKSFMFKYFTNANAVIQVDDKPGGLLSGKGLLTPNIKGFAGMMAAGMSYETPIEIRVKDGRYRYEISNIVVIGQGARLSIDDAIRRSREDAIRRGRPTPEKIEMNEKQYLKYLEATRPFTSLIEQLKLTMAKPTGKEDF